MKSVSKVNESTETGNKGKIPFLQSEFETVGRVASCNLSGVGPPPHKFPQPVTTQLLPAKMRRIHMLSL